MQASDKQAMEVEMTDVAMERHDHEVQHTAMLEKRQYHQATTISELETNDWATLPDLPAPPCDDTPSVAHLYWSAFTILSQRWGVSPAECLPEELRLVTPYSLGLVVRLAQLALLTPSHKEQAHATLFATSRDRYAEMALRPDFPPSKIFSTGMDRGIPLKRLLELKVQERIGGLILEDVEMVKVQFAEYSPQSKAEYLAAQAKSRGDRAAKRMNRDCGNDSREQESQLLDAELLTYVGDLGHGRWKIPVGMPGWKEEQTRLTREAGQGGRGEGRAAGRSALRRQGRGKGGRVLKMDSADGTNGRTRGQARVEKKQSKREKKRDKREDKKLAGLLKDFNMAKDGRRPNRDSDTTREGRVATLPSERITMPSSLLLPEMKRPFVGSPGTPGT